MGVVEEPLTISPRINNISWHGSPKPNPSCGAPDLLKEGMRYVFAVKGDEGKEALDLSSRGPDAAASKPSCCSNDALSATGLRSKPLSTPDSRTPSSNRPTPKSGSSHASATASTNPKRSSLSLFSPLADTAPNSHDDTHGHVRRARFRHSQRSPAPGTAGRVPALPGVFPRPSRAS